MTFDLQGLGTQIDLLKLRIYEDTQDWHWTPAPREHFNIWLALEAHGVFEIEGKSRSFASGSIFIFPPDVCPAGRCLDGRRIINFTAHLRARGKAAKTLRALAGEVDYGPVHLRNFIWASHLCRYLSDIFYLDESANRPLALSGIELLLRSMLRDHRLPPTDSVHEALIAAIGRIRRNPAASYTVREMAASARLSTAQFSRRFKAITGLTPNRFLIEERIARAESYLRETTMSVQEIAARLGYGDVYFFSRQFRSFRGVPPTRVRQKG